MGGASVNAVVSEVSPCHLCGQPLVQQDGFWACPTHTLSVKVDGTVLYRALPKQYEFHLTKERWTLMGGAAGGSKSHAGRWDLLLAGLEAPGMPMLLLRRTLKELENTHITNASGTGLAQLPSSLGTWHAQAKRFTLANGAYIQCGYCDNDADFAQYLSTEWGRVFVDEASQFTPFQMVMLNTRVRLPTTMPFRVQMRLGSNPGGPLHQFLRERFVDRTGTTDGTPYDPTQYRFIPARVHDNPYQTQEYIDELLKLPAQERAMYYDGTWDLPMGNLFAELTTSHHRVPCAGPWDRSRRVVVADWGWTAPAPAIWVETDQGLGGVSYSRAYREWVPTQTIPQEWAKEVVRLSTLPDGSVEIEAVILDSAAFDPRQDGGPSMAEQMLPTFRQAGVRLIPSVKGPGSIDRGIQLLHTYFWTGPDGTLRPLLTIGDTCPQTWNALVTIQRGDATKGQPTDLPAPRAPQTHIVDAIRYFVQSRPKPAEVPFDQRLRMDVELSALQNPMSQVAVYQHRKLEAKAKGQPVPIRGTPVKPPPKPRLPWAR